MKNLLENMKFPKTSLSIYLQESLSLDMKLNETSLLDDFDALDKNLNDSIEKEVKKWILDNYQVIPSSLRILKRPNKDSKLIVNTNHAIFNSDSKSLTNGMFVWGKIKNQFVCSRSLITSLEGAPQYVGGFFYCNHCNSLKSLEGAPKEVGGNFDCSRCDSLKSIDIPTTTKIKGKIIDK